MHAGVNCVCNVCGSAHSCGCVVNFVQECMTCGHDGAK